MMYILYDHKVMVVAPANLTETSPTEPVAESP